MNVPRPGKVALWWGFGTTVGVLYLLSQRQRRGKIDLVSPEWEARRAELTANRGEALLAAVREALSEQFTITELSFVPRSAPPPDTGVRTDAHADRLLVAVAGSLNPARQRLFRSLVGQALTSVVGVPVSVMTRPPARKSRSGNLEDKES